VYFIEINGDAIAASLKGDAIVQSSAGQRSANDGRISEMHLSCPLAVLQIDLNFIISRVTLRFSGSHFVPIPPNVSLRHVRHS